MELVNDILARDRRGDSMALVTPSGRERSYRELLTNAWKAANVLRHLGVHQQTTVSVTPQKQLHPLLAFLGAAQLGAVTRFTHPHSLTDRPRAAVVPVQALTDIEIDAETKLTCYGGAAESPEIVHWEEELWSENPAQAPATHGPEAPVIGSESAVYTHLDIIEAGRAISSEHEFGTTTTVAVHGSLADPRIVVGGIVAPLLSGGTILFPSDDRESEPTPGDVAMIDDRGAAETAVSEASSAVSHPEPRSIVASQIPL